MKLPTEKVERWAKILEDNGLIIIENPVFGGPLLKIVQEEQAGKDQIEKKEHKRGQ